MKTAIIKSIGVIGLCASSVLGQTGDPAKLISIKKCAMCHKKDDKGNQYGKWQAMGHAKAYETLGTEEAKAVGTKLGIDDPQSSGKCLKCHSTAYFFTEERQTEEITLENGVSCQSCHGPGADYKKKSIMESLEQSIANGMVHPAKEKSCTLCHNDTSPTWNPDRYTLPSGEKTGFDVEQAYEKIKHERPAQ
jgi:Zn-finger protein